MLNYLLNQDSLDNKNIKILLCELLNTSAIEFVDDIVIEILLDNINYKTIENMILRDHCNNIILNTLRQHGYDIILNGQVFEYINDSNTDVIEWLLEVEGDDIYEYYYDDTIIDACIAGKINMIKLLVNKYGMPVKDIKYCISRAFTEGHFELMRYLNPDNKYTPELFHISNISIEHFKIMEEFNINYDYSILRSITDKYHNNDIIPLLDYVINKWEVQVCNCINNGALLYALFCNNYIVFKYIYEYGLKKNIISNDIIESIKHEIYNICNIDIFKYLINVIKIPLNDICFDNKPLIFYIINNINDKLSMTELCENFDYIISLDYPSIELDKIKLYINYYIPLIGQYILNDLHSRGIELIKYLLNNNISSCMLLFINIFNKPYSYDKNIISEFDDNNDIIIYMLDELYNRRLSESCKYSTIIINEFEESYKKKIITYIIRTSHNYSYIKYDTIFNRLLKFMSLEELISLINDNYDDSLETMEILNSYLIDNYLEYLSDNVKLSLIFNCIEFNKLDKIDIIINSLNGDNYSWNIFNDLSVKRININIIKKLLKIKGFPKDTIGAWLKSSIDRGYTSLTKYLIKNYNFNIKFKIYNNTNYYSPTRGYYTTSDNAGININDIIANGAAIIDDTNIRLGENNYNFSSINMDSFIDIIDNELNYIDTHLSRFDIINMHYFDKIKSIINIINTDIINKPKLVDLLRTSFINFNNIINRINDKINQTNSELLIQYHIQLLNNINIENIIEVENDNINIILEYSHPLPLDIKYIIDYINYDMKYYNNMYFILNSAALSNNISLINLLPRNLLPKLELDSVGSLKTLKYIESIGCVINYNKIIKNCSSLSIIDYIYKNSKCNNINYYKIVADLIFNFIKNIYSVLEYYLNNNIIKFNVQLMLEILKCDGSNVKIWAKNYIKDLINSLLTWPLYKPIYIISSNDIIAQKDDCRFYDEKIIIGPNMRQILMLLINYNVDIEIINIMLTIPNIIDSKSLLGIMKLININEYSNIIISNISYNNKFPTINYDIFKLLLEHGDIHNNLSYNNYEVLYTILTTERTDLINLVLSHCGDIISKNNFKLLINLINNDNIVNIMNIFKDNWKTIHFTKSSYENIFKLLYPKGPLSLVIEHMDIKPKVCKNILKELVENTNHLSSNSECPTCFKKYTKYNKIILLCCNMRLCVDCSSRITACPHCREKNYNKLNYKYKLL